MAKDTSSKPKPKKKTAKAAKKTATKADPYIPKVNKLTATQVLTGLEKSGFPLELSVRKILRDSGWIINVNRPFMDYSEDPPVERTVDILARKTCNPKSKVINEYQLNLIVECKQQNETAWIFDIRKKRKINWDDKNDAMIYCGDSVMSAKTELWDASVFGLLGQASHQCPENFEHMSFSGTFYYEGGENGAKKKKQPDLLYKGSSQVIGALINLNKSLTRRSESSPSLFWRNYPVLVFNGSLFYAFLDKKGELKLEDTKYVHYYQHTTMRGYWVDVISIDFLREYLSYVNNEFENSKIILDEFVTIEKE